MFRICPFLLFFLFYHSSYNIYFVLSWNKNGQPSCSNVSCSNDKLSYIYDNSKFILSELENILYDVRDQRNSHELENEYDKELDIQIKFPHNKDYHDLQILDDQYEEEKKYSEPVPYITISNLEEDSDDLKKSFINDNIYNEDTSTNRPLNEEEQIDIALSKIYELEEKMKMFKEHNGKQNFKKYLR